MAGEADAAYPTELAGVAEMGTEAVEAWSLDDADADYPLTGSWEDPERPERRLTSRSIAILAAVASIVAVGAVVGFGVWKLREPSEPNPTTLAVVVATATATATATVTAVAAPTPVETVLPTAQAPVTVVQTRAPQQRIATTSQDQRLVDTMQAQGWSVYNPEAMTSQAHSICARLRAGSSLQSVVGSLLNGPENTSPHGARSFVDTVMEIYPDCP